MAATPPSGAPSKEPGSGGFESLFKVSEAPSRAITLQELRQRMVRVIEVMASIHLANYTASGFMAAGMGIHTKKPCAPQRKCARDQPTGAYSE
ncbi:hypothetical protein EBQ34_06335 [Vandammella animalimorsus]|uniref:Uncharacterized protein n=1 Tax=Vandammella animalimorsus TaxID=2029117 RepID=A0A3M6RLQ3_9BURK|nr:hypothetical protein EBQ34_06335 [Vandammella animalimorsus]